MARLHATLAVAFALAAGSVAAVERKISGLHGRIGTIGNATFSARQLAKFMQEVSTMR